MEHAYLILSTSVRRERLKANLHLNKDRPEVVCMDKASADAQAEAWNADNKVRHFWVQPIWIIDPLPCS